MLLLLLNININKQSLQGEDTSHIYDDPQKYIQWSYLWLPHFLLIRHIEIAHNNRTDDDDHNIHSMTS